MPLILKLYFRGLFRAFDFSYAHKKREVRLFFTLIQGFAIPHTVEKQPKSTPDIYTQPHPLGVEVDNTYPRDIHCCCLDCV